MMNFATFEAQETDVWQEQNSNADLFAMDSSYFGKPGWTSLGSAHLPCCQDF